MLGLSYHGDLEWWSLPSEVDSIYQFFWTCGITAVGAVLSLIGYDPLCFRVKKPLFGDGILYVFMPVPFFLYER